MRCIGFAIKKGELWYVVLDGIRKSDCKIVKTGKQIFRAESVEVDLMSDFYNLFDIILTKFNPDKVAYKVHLNSDLKQIPYMHYPLGVLNYLCKLKGKPATGRSGSWITAGKNKKGENCKSYFENQSLKNEELAAILIAWHEFED